MNAHAGAGTPAPVGMNDVRLQLWSREISLARGRSARFPAVCERTPTALAAGESHTRESGQPDGVHTRGGWKMEVARSIGRAEMGAKGVREG